MPNPLMYESDDAYVLLEPDQPEQFLTPTELLEKLKAILADRQDDLPQDLEKFTDLNIQAKHLMETACELDMEPGQFLQWYVVRLEK
ncbi:MAG: chlororespiratory reduction protein 7 [Leptolyngbyaceae cyanobacterium CRU_2_3]|nr:chlororespiratory reduction protein 7 [Leptolyngbyaceae cyanobacterium CRU_2_3]